MWNSEQELEAPLKGATINEVWVSEDRLVFVTDKGNVAYVVYGDCCSYSYFHDIVGVDKLLFNGPVLELNSIELGSDFQPDDNENGEYYNDYIQVYGYEIVTEHPLFGDQTTVIAFRNSSNGYYGGWMELDSHADLRDEHKITEDWVNLVS